MSKLKKIYYIIFFVISLCMCSPATIYASDVSSEEITDKADDMKLSDGAQGVTTDADGTNGISIQYNNDSGSISTPVRMLLVLTVLTLAPSILILISSEITKTSRGIGLLFLLVPTSNLIMSHYLV